MNATTEPPSYSLAPALGVVNEATVYGIDVYVAGTDDRILHDASVTIRQAKGIPGWVGILDGDVTAYRAIRLELRRPGSTDDFAVLFMVGGGTNGRTLIRGTDQHLAPLE
jgi:hypothetical protein